MKMKAIVVGEKAGLILESEPTPNPNWLNDGVIRWLTIEGGSRDELEHLFNNLGINGSFLADHIKGDDWLKLD